MATVEAVTGVVRFGDAVKSVVTPSPVPILLYSDAIMTSHSFVPLKPTGVPADTTGTGVQSEALGRLVISAKYT